jgi:hypothetical protein
VKGGRKEGRKEGRMMKKDDEGNKVKKRRKITQKGCRREHGGRKVKERRKDTK